MKILDALIAALAAACGLAGVAPAGAADAAPAPVSPRTFKPTAAQLAALKVVVVERASFRAEHVAEGKIALDGDRTTPVFSPYSGRVTRVLANPGDSVRQGQPLLALEASEFVQGQNDLLAAQSALATARAQLSLAQVAESRKHALYDAKAGALQDWQQSQADLAAAQGGVRAAEAQFAAVRNRLRILGRGDADIDALARADRIDPVAAVVAPISGTVTDRQVGPGQYLQAGASNPVFTIGDLSTVWLVANVREADAPFVRKGDPIEVRVDALPGRLFKAKLAFVAPALDPASRRLAVRADLPNPDGLLKPEMFATFSILTAADRAAPAVPTSGVVYEGSDARVWIVAADGSLALRHIRPGRSFGGLVEVLEGVQPGEKVVASGALFIDRAAAGE
ncbi:MAG TPA: efflux RND transporter periplasmic adaptor subunit [Burkholderiaceae bacterium]|nr:efflux RND transporter periplasmic adaptor subunit [Burkholderiaceae bacterium]